MLCRNGAIRVCGQLWLLRYLPTLRREALHIESFDFVGTASVGSQVLGHFPPTGPPETPPCQHKETLDWSCKELTENHRRTCSDAELRVPRLVRLGGSYPSLHIIIPHLWPNRGLCGYALRIPHAVRRTRGKGPGEQTARSLWPKVLALMLDSARPPAILSVSRM